MIALLCETLIVVVDPYLTDPVSLSLSLLPLGYMTTLTLDLASTVFSPALGPHEWSIDPQTQRYTPPSPPVAFTVPWDVFYPFYISTSGGTASTPSHSTMDGFCIAVALLGLSAFWTFSANSFPF